MYIFYFSKKYNQQPSTEYTPRLFPGLPWPAAADSGEPRQLPENASCDPEILGLEHSPVHGGKTEPTVSPVQTGIGDKSAGNRSINIYNRQDMSGNILKSTWASTL